MELLLPFLNFIKTVALNTGSILIVLFGGLFIFGFILYLMARLTRNSFAKSIGSNFDHYFTGWIGTPIHELGHALFCIPFGHKIVAMNLFLLKPRNNTLGYVNHSYNSRNIWHQIGNFFIGIGPIILGSIVLILLLKFLLLNGNDVINLIIDQSNGLDQFSSMKLFVSNSWSIIQQIFSTENVSSWQFWLFLYLTLSIATHMELSPSDLKGALRGFISIVIAMFLVNALFLSFNNELQIGMQIRGYIDLFTGILFFASLLSMLFFIGSFVILNLYTMLIKRNFFHPFG